MSPSLIRRQLLGDVPDPDDVTLLWLMVVSQFQRRLATKIAEMAEDQLAADRSGNAAWISSMDFLRRLRKNLRLISNTYIVFTARCYTT